MFERESYIGQIFGNRLIVADQCQDSDWVDIGKPVPSEKSKYRLSECLNCGSYIPVLIPNIQRQPPKRCSFCSNIAHRSNKIPNTNNWIDTENGYAVGNILYKSEIITCYIDSEDYDRVSARIWRVNKKKNKYYLVSGSVSKGTLTYLHQYILNVSIPDGYEIDHIDCNSLNNRKNNLRIVTRLQNIQNVSERIDNQIGIRGIVKTSSGRYSVDFSYNKHRVYVKDWSTLQEAIYCRKYLEEYFGLNIINRNPIAQKYFTLSEKESQLIKQYVSINISKETVLKSTRQSEPIQRREKPNSACADGPT